MTRNGDANATLERVLDALAHRRRRQLVAALDEHPADGALAVPGLAPEDADPDSFVAELHHDHLPKLAEHGYVEYDDDTLTVRRGEEYAEVAEALSVLRAHCEVPAIEQF